MKDQKKSGPEPILHVDGSTDIRLWSLTLADRLRRQFARLGVVNEQRLDTIRSYGGQVIAARADAVIDQPLVALLAKSDGLVLLENGVSPSVIAVAAPASMIDTALAILRGDNAPDSAGWAVSAPENLQAAFWQALRKKEVPYARRVTAANQSEIEWRMFMGTYKGATDLVTKHVWPRPAFYITRWLAPLGVSPNMVTTVAALATLAAFILFLNGQFAAGLVTAWLMTFLDTVDGKLARTTLTSSKWGDVFDHGIDLVHPPFWYVAWAVGLDAVGMGLTVSQFWWAVGLILGGYVLQRVIEGIAIKWLGLEIHIWRPIDTFFRQITARRNPNLILLTVSVLFGRPDLGLLAVAAWTVICLVLHGLQLQQAFAARAKSGGALQSWMSRT